MTFIDFNVLKEMVSILDAIPLLALPVKQVGDTYRGSCPSCKGDERSLVLSPAKGSFYCFPSKKGGDVIALVAHVNGTSMKDAAQFLLNREVKDDFQPLTYLEAEHEAVTAIMAVSAAKALGVGYARKGILRGRIAFPLRRDDGTLLGYLGVAPKADVKLPKNLEKTDGDGTQGN